MNYKVLSLAFLGGGFLLFWLYLGIEWIQIAGDSESPGGYEFFTKHTPGFQVIYKNSAKCGECDHVSPWESMTKDEIAEFSAYCRVRFGLEEVRQCYAIFRERRQMADERRGLPQ
jgi:hypothetical protein